MAKKSSSQPIKTTMTGMHGMGFPKTTQSRDQGKGPRKFAKGEVSNEVSRPPKH